MKKTLFHLLLQLNSKKVFRDNEDYFEYFDRVKRWGPAENIPHTTKHLSTEDLQTLREYQIEELNRFYQMQSKTDVIPNEVSNIIRTCVEQSSITDLISLDFAKEAFLTILPFIS